MERLPFSCLLICLMLVLGVCQDGVEAQSKPCRLPKTNKPGTCVAIQRCRNIYNIVIKPTPQNKIYDSYIAKAACTLPGVTRSICCSPGEVVRESSSSTTTPRARTCNKRDVLPKECGRKSDGRISHGNATEVFAYPWMAVLLYNENGKIVDGCGGSLINKRYVLTAAHCINIRGKKLHSVVLGEHTKNQTVDCNIYPDNNGNEEERDCADPIEEFGIESFVIHQDYNRPRKHAHDIGLIRLDQDVRMKDHIKPICLPITEALQTQAFRNYIVTGWGTTEHGTASNVLLEATLNHVEIASCQQEMKTLRINVGLSDKQICAQGKGSEDSCRGDSGGPLVSSASYASGDATPVTRFVQLGIVSFGIEPCGQKSAPGIYCRVASYMDWILEHIECGV